jgi:Tfp pilus assembly PilM family ATPase
VSFLAVYRDGRALKVAKMRQEKNKKYLDFLKTLPVSNAQEIVKPLYNLETIFNSHAKIITGIKASELFFRTVEIKLSDKKKILATLPYQLEDILPYPFKEAMVTPIIEKDQKNLSAKVRLYSTKKDFIKNHINTMRSLAADPDLISSSVCALMRYIKFFYSEDTTAVFFYIGYEESVALCLIEGKLEMSYSFDYTISSIKEAMRLDAAHLSEEEIDKKIESQDFIGLCPKDHPHTFDVLLSCQKEISRIMYYFSSRPLTKEVKNILLVGSFSSMNRLKEFFLGCFPKELTHLPTPDYEGFDAVTLEAYAIPIGLSLEACSLDGKALNFRQRELLSMNMVKKRLKKLSLLFFGCMVLSGLVFTGSSFHLKKKEKSLLNLCYEYFPETQGDELEPILSKIHSRLIKEKKQPTLSSGVRSVSEVISYLTHHPKIQCKAGAFIPLETIEIHKIHYEIKRPPRLATPGVIPQVKVELEFSCPSSRTAKELHEAIRKGDKFIDEREEITWQVKDSIYKTSFFVKPKGEKG